MMAAGNVAHAFGPEAMERNKLRKMTDTSMMQKVVNDYPDDFKSDVDDDDFQGFRQ